MSMSTGSCNATIQQYERAMPRPLGLQFSGALYRLISRGNARQKIFFDDADRELFLKTLAQVVSRYRCMAEASSSRSITSFRSIATLRSSRFRRFKPFESL